MKIEWQKLYEYKNFNKSYALIKKVYYDRNTMIVNIYFGKFINDVFYIYNSEDLEPLYFLYGLI